MTLREEITGTAPERREVGQVRYLLDRNNPSQPVPRSPAVLLSPPLASLLSVCASLRKHRVWGRAVFRRPRLLRFVAACHTSCEQHATQIDPAHAHSVRHIYWMWSNLNTRNAGLQAGFALDKARRDGTFRRGLRKEARAAALVLSDEDRQAYYSRSAMDQRCALRYATDIVGCLRAWARTVEAHARTKLKSSHTVVSVTENMYTAAIFKASLALSAIPTREELLTSAQEDWDQDSAGNDAISFERFKDAIFQLADTWVDSIDSADYAAFLELLLKSCSSADGASFLDDDAIVRGVARPEGYEEDPKQVKARERREEMQQARERREAALLLQRQQRLRRQQREERERALYEQELLARAAKRRAAEDARRRQEAELDKALKAAAAAGAAGKAAKAKAARALELKCMAEQSRLRLRFRALGLLPALTSPREEVQKLHIEDQSFDEARVWMEDADDIDKWERSGAPGSLAPTTEAPPGEEERSQLQRELQLAGVFPSHARGILKRASQPLQPQPPSSPRMGSPRVPTLNQPSSASLRSGASASSVKVSPRLRLRPIAAGFRAGSPRLDPLASSSKARSPFPWDTFMAAAAACE